MLDLTAANKQLADTIMAMESKTAQIVEERKRVLSVYDNKNDALSTVLLLLRANSRFQDSLVLKS